MVWKRYRPSRKSQHRQLQHGRTPAGKRRRVAAQVIASALVALLPITVMGVGLVSTGSQFWRPADLWTGGSPPVPGAFAAAVATGDFDNDGLLDLAIGDRFADVGAIQDAGVVTVIYGSATGLVTAGNQLWHQDVGSVPDTAEAFDYFGWALAVGDFDNDGYDDLAIGTASENFAVSNAGSVQVLYGSVSGLTDVGSQDWHQDVGSVQGTNQTGDSFGAALASGDFDGDGYGDLGVGVPGQSGSAGLVIVLYGSGAGLVDTGNQLFDQTDLGGDFAAGDLFGSVLASGDFDNNGSDDLAIGSPGEDRLAAVNTGVVDVIYGDGSGLNLLLHDPAQTWWQYEATGGSSSEAESDDEFGSALAVGDFDADGYDDLAIGAPGEDGDAGSVHQLTGSSSGLEVNATRRFDQGEGIFSGLLGTEAALDRFGHALASGDFDADGYDDLAIGVPDEQEGPVAGAGAVNVVYGDTPYGLEVAGNQYFSQDDAQIDDVPEAGDLFGWSLAAGDFDGDGASDLAVGAPFELEVTPVGAVNVIYGYGPCGNGVINPGEECDDDNIVDGDGCTSTCVAEICGDGVTQPGIGEECDDSNSTSEDGCSDVCIVEFCGDSVTQAGLGESCDDGNTTSGDGCSDVCIAEFCGDGAIQPGLGESCDDSNSTGGDGCSAACWPELGGADLFGTSMGGSVSITVAGVLVTITTVPGQTAAEILAALAAAILADPTLSGLGVQVAVIGDRLYTSFAATGYTLNDLGLSETASAAVTVAYTDDAAFGAALAGPATTEDFDGLTGGDPVDTLGDLTFYTAAPVELPLATEAFDTPSAPVSLGIDNLDEALLDGDPLEIALAVPADAIALRIVTSDPALLDEMILVTPVGAAFNAALVESTASDGGHIYFVGLVSDTPFSNVVLGFEEDAATNFVYTVDDVQVRFVPEPGFMLSLGSGVAFLALAQRRRERASRRAQGRSR
jgi:cysteine-rich repeat protein